MANVGSFRTALNGFRREDVLRELESTGARYQALAAQRDELAAGQDALRQQCSEQAEKLAALEQERAAWEREKAALEQALAAQRQQAALEQERQQEEAAMELELAREQALQLRQERDEARQEAERNASALKQLRLSTAENNRKLREYEALHDRVSTLELNAARRACEIEQAAQVSADALRLQARQETDRLCAAFVAAREELDRALAVLETAGGKAGADA